MIHHRDTETQRRLVLIFSVPLCLCGERVLACMQGMRDERVRGVLCDLGESFAISAVKSF